MMDWEQWQTLLAVCRFGTHSGAAKALRVDPTTVGRRLRLLERSVGYPLLMRQDGRLHPSHQCESLLSHLETASEALRAAEQLTATADAGRVWRSLRLTAAPYLIRNLFAPAVGSLTRSLRVRIDLMGAMSNASLTRREADIAVRIDDQPGDPNVVAERIGDLTYAVYCAAETNPDTLPWAGLTEEYMGTPGGRIMTQLAGPNGFQYRASHYDPLYKITRSGIARAMLPCFAADQDARLKLVRDNTLKCPLWMLYHRQDSDVPHLKQARSWIRQLAIDKLANDQSA